MKKILIVTALTLLIASSVQAQNWIEFENKTKGGAVYAALCNACLGGTYNNDNFGYWSCTDAPQDGDTPCFDALRQALANSEEYGGQ